MKRFLITTAQEETWHDDEPVLFLGEGCRLHSRKDRLVAMDAEVLPYHWDDRAKLYADYQYLQRLYERLLPDVTEQFNQIHGVDHGVRILARCLETLGDPRILRHRARRIEPALITGQAPNIGNRITTHPLGAGHLVIRLSRPTSGIG